MPNPRPALVVLGVPVYMPASSYFGLALLAWFALPAAQGLTDSAWWLWPIAFLHGAAVYVAVFAHEFGHVLAGRWAGYQSPGIVVHFWGGHTTYPMLNMTIPDYQHFSDRVKTRDFLVVTSEGGSCDRPQQVVLFVDISDPTRPVSV